MTFRLFVDSTTGVDVNPEWGMKESGQKVESRHRTRDGSELVYKWGDVTLLDVPVMHVNSSFRAQVNSWWGGNVDLLWMEEGGTEITSVHIVNSTKPIDSFVRPYNDKFKGVIKLGTY